MAEWEAGASDSLKRQVLWVPEFLGEEAKAAGFQESRRRQWLGEDFHTDGVEMELTEHYVLHPS